MLTKYFWPLELSDGTLCCLLLFTFDLKCLSMQIQICIIGNNCFFFLSWYHCAVIYCFVSSFCSVWHVFFFIYCRQEMLWQVRWWNNWSLMELMLSKLVSAQVSTVVYLPHLNCQLCWECQDTVILWFQYSTLHTAWACCRSDLRQFLMCRSTCLVIFWCVSCCLIRVCLYHASSDWCRISTT